MKTRLRLSVVTVLLIFRATSCAFAAQLGFESGNFAGWDVVVPTYSTDEYGLQKVGGAFVKTTGTSWWDYAAYTPVEGRFLAELVVDNSALSTGGYVAVQRSFQLKAGDSVSGWAAFTTEDDLPTDWASARIFDGFGSALATPWSATSGYDGYSEHGLPWSFWSWTAPVSGRYLLELRAGTGGDAQMGSSALFDGITVTKDKGGVSALLATAVAVPDNSDSVILLASGLALIALFRTAASRRVVDRKQLR